MSDDDNVFSPCALVYVRMQTVDVDEWRDKVLSTFGGKTHVRCTCNNFPLIPRLKLSNRESRKCMKCHRNEYMVCCNKTCPVRLCRTCYNQYPTNDSSTISPPSNGGDPSASAPQDPGGSIGRVIEDKDADENDEDRSIDQSSLDPNSDLDDNLPFDGNAGEDFDSDEDETDHFVMANFMSNSYVDESQELDANPNTGFFTTNAADVRIEIKQDPSMEKVSGHVLFNRR